MSFSAPQFSIFIGGCMIASYLLYLSPYFFFKAEKRKKVYKGMVPVGAVCLSLGLWYILVPKTDPADVIICATLAIIYITSFICSLCQINPIKSALPFSLGCAICVGVYIGSGKYMLIFPPAMGMIVFYFFYYLDKKVDDELFDLKYHDQIQDIRNAHRDIAQEQLLIANYRNELRLWKENLDAAMEDFKKKRSQNQ